MSPLLFVIFNKKPCSILYLQLYNPDWNIISHTQQSVNKKDGCLKDFRGIETFLQYKKPLFQLLVLINFTFYANSLKIQAFSFSFYASRITPLGQTSLQAPHPVHFS